MLVKLSVRCAMLTAPQNPILDASAPAPALNPTPSFPCRSVQTHAAAELNHEESQDDDFLPEDASRMKKLKRDLAEVGV